MAVHSPPPLTRRLNCATKALLLVGSLMGMARAAEPAGWIENLHLSATGSLATVDNISRTSYEPTRKDAQTYEFGLASTHARQLAPSILLVVSAAADSLTVSDYTLNNNVRLGGRLQLQKKFGLGPQAPVLELGAAGNYKAARFDDDRGWTTEATLQLSKRVLPNLRLAARANWQEHTARRDVFDTSQHSYGLDARWDIDDHWSLSGSAGRLSGDIVANAAWSVWYKMLEGDFGPTIFDYYTARPWHTTNLWGPGWVSYNVEADVDLWSVALGYAFSDRTSIEVRRDGAYVVNRVGVAYPTSSWGLNVTHRF